MSTFTIQIDDDMPYETEWYEGFTFGHIFDVVRRALHRKGENLNDINIERILFYDRENRRIEFGYDGHPIEEGSFIRAIYINENDRLWAWRSPPEATATWPWPQGWEAMREEYERRHREFLRMEAGQ
jgi:hypothetical protein